MVDPTISNSIEIRSVLSGYESLNKIDFPTPPPIYAIQENKVQLRRTEL